MSQTTAVGSPSVRYVLPAGETMADADRVTIRRCLDGHVDEFRVLIARYQRPLVVYLGGRLWRRAEVEDAAQETFVRAFEMLARLENRDAFFSWLLGIANHVSLEAVRRSRRDEVAPPDGNERELESAVDPLAGRPDEELDRAVASLSRPLQEVILLRFFGDCSCAEIAQRLDLSIGTVTKRLSRAYAELRGRLAE